MKAILRNESRTGGNESPLRVEKLAASVKFKRSPKDWAQVGDQSPWPKFCFEFERDRTEVSQFVLTFLADLRFDPNPDSMIQARFFLSNDINYLVLNNAKAIKNNILEFIFLYFFRLAPFLLENLTPLFIRWMNKLMKNMFTISSGTVKII